LRGHDDADRKREGRRHQSEHRSIYAEESPEEAKELHEEGVAFHPLPVLPDEFN